MKDFTEALASISFIVLVLGFLYKKIKRSFLSEPIIALLSGILLGPQVLNVLDMHNWGPFEKIMEVATQLTISMALMATALRIPKNYLKQAGLMQGILLSLGMLGMCAMSTLLVHFILGVSWIFSFLIGAVVTPTDPVISATVVSGETAKKLIPDRVRHAISFESGANDGMAFPLVFLPLLLIQKPGKAWEEWLLKSILWETGAAILFGLIIGYVAGKLLVKARDAGWMSKSVLLSFSLSLGFFVLSILELIHCNGIIGVFAAGFAANQVLGEDEDIEQEGVQESMGRIFTIPIFMLFGLILPWSDWMALGWNAVWIVVAILLFRRLPVILLLGPLLKKLPKMADLIIGRLVWPHWRSGAVLYDDQPEGDRCAGSMGSW
ncbi:cation:proton antiporter [Pontibacter chitinilyticus]|uniref:cation:proton antiporter domain-containing protein n=1 Tax=Pontibacter chitinilyticus TaxID=2674989 RepID=UPI00321A3E74